MKLPIRYPLLGLLGVIFLASFLILKHYSAQKPVMAKTVAEDFVTNSPTYKFDGFDLKLESSQAGQCPGCFDFVFSFSSRQGGYGDRTGQMLIQVITPHRIIVRTAKDPKTGEIKVASAITDAKYDELGQHLLPH